MFARIVVPTVACLAGTYGIGVLILRWLLPESMAVGWQLHALGLALAGNCVVNSLFWLPRGWAALRNFTVLFFLEGSGLVVLWGVAFILAVMAMGGPSVTKEQADATFFRLHASFLLFHLCLTHLTTYALSRPGKVTQR